MNSALRPSTRLPGLYSNWLRPDSNFDRNFFDMEAGFVPMRVGVNVPPVNIKETPDEYTLEIAAPGLDKKDLHVEVENHKLKISADKVKEAKPEGKYRNEFSFHSFSRFFDLPDNTTDRDIEAHYENGILTVHVNKVKQKTAREVHEVLVS